MRHRGRIFIFREAKQLSLRLPSCQVWEPRRSGCEPLTAGGRKEAAELREARPESQLPGFQFNSLDLP